MDLNSFFGTPKWKVLELLAEKPLSPSELSVQLETSVAYVSQQLKLLEAAGLIVKQRTGIADKGKPRSLYSLSKEVFSLAVLARGWSSKKVFHLTEYHKLILRIWLIDNVSLHYPVERIYWELEHYIKDIYGIFFSDKGSNELIIVSDMKILKSKIDSILKNTKEIRILLFSKEDFLKKSLPGIFSIYDPGNILAVKLKGGVDNEK